MRQAEQQLAQFAGQITRLTSQLNQFSQAFQQAFAQNQQGLAALPQRAQQASQSFQQFNTQLNQTRQTFVNITQTTQQFNTQLSNTTNTVNQAGQAMQRAQGATNAWSQALQVASGIGLAVTLEAIIRALVNFIRDSVQLAAKMQDLHRSFVAIEGSGQAANRTLGGLFDLAQRAGVGFTGLANSFRRLESAAKGTTLSHADLMRAQEGMTLGARVMGASTEENSRALNAWAQILSKGRLTSEELVQQLAEAVPQALNVLSRGLGITTQQLRAMTEAGLIPGTVALVAFSEEMRKVGQGAGPIQSLSATFANLANETKAWMTAIGTSIGETLQPWLDKIVEISKALRELLGIRDPGQATPGTGRATAEGPFTARTQFPIAPSPYTALIQQQAMRTGVDPGLASRVMQAESGFQADIEGPLTRFGTKAQGLMQLMLTTAQQLEMGVTAENIREPERNIRLGMTYLGNLLEQFRGFPDQVQLAVAAYNAGPGRVENLLNEARRAGTPTTFEAIAPRLPAETQAYVSRVVNAPALPTAAALAAGTAGAVGTPEQQAEATNKIVTTWQKSIEDTLTQFGVLQKQVEALNQSGANFGGIMSKDVAQAAERVVQKLVDINQAFATLPALSEKLPASLREQVILATQQGVVWKEMLLTDQQRATLLERQVEGMEQVVSRQKAQLISQREGQEAAERFTRLDAARLAAAKIDDRVERAALTLTQQIAADAAKLQALQNEAAQLSADLEARRVEAMRPQLESQLQRIQAFIGRPDQSLAEQARQQVLTQGTTAQAKLVKLIQETARHPALQDLQEAFQHAFQALPEAVERQSGRAFEAVERQMRETLRGMEDQLDQISQRTGAAGLSPFEADLARIRREAARTTDQLEAMVAALEKLRLGATPEAQQSIDAMVGRVQAMQARQPAAEANALMERQERDGRRLIEDMESRLVQMQEGPGAQGFPFSEPREAVQVRRQAARMNLTEDQEMSVQLLQRQIVEQDKLNYAVGIWYNLSQTIGQSWSQSLMSVIDGTMSVSQAFENMGKAILKTMADIAAQQATMALFKLGAGLLTAGLTGGMTGGAAPAGAFANPGGLEVMFQHGGVVNAPTRALIGENPAHNPKVILNRQQMQSMFGGSGGHGQQNQVIVNNFPDRKSAEEDAARQRGQGHTVIVNAILDELSTGESSRINRAMRALQR